MKKALFFVMALLLGHIAFATATLPGNWRWRNDDGTEVTATWSAAESTPLTLTSIASPIRLRLSSYSNTLSNTDVGVLQYTTDPSAAADPGNVSATFNTAWITIPTSGTGAAFTTSASSVIGTATINPTTPQLSQSGTRTDPFAGGSLFTTLNGSTGSIVAGKRYEIEFTIKPTVRIANSTTYYFRTYATGNNQAPATANYLNGLANLVTAATISPITYPGGVGSGLKLWLKADKDVTLVTGTNVSTWYDESGNINDVSQATAGSQPTKVDGSINFNPALNFNSDYLVNIGGALGNTAYTGTSAFLVGHELVRTAAYPIYQITPGINYVGFVAPWSDGYPYFGYGAAQTTAASATVALGTTNLFGGVSTNTPSNSQRISVNGTQTGSFTNSPNFTATFGNLGIGGTPTGTGLYNGNIGEVIMYGRGLSTTEEQQVNSYQAIKYGLTLSTNYLSSASTVLWNATTNVTYKNNIAAIGRDDLSGLYQNQSQSENTGSQVTVAIGTAATTNQLNVTNATTDKQFLIWGDDATSLLPVTSTGLVAAPNRVTRVWKTQNTNMFAQQVTVYFPTIYFASPYLIYGSTAASLSNGTASAIANSGMVTIGGVSNYAFTIPAATMGSIGFFSFGGVVLTPGGVAGASLWVKADDATVSVTPTTWVNQIGGTDLTGSGTNAFSNATANLVNFNPSVVFNGTNSRYDAATSFMPNGTTTFDAFVATKCVSAPGTVSLFYFGDQSAPTTATNRVQFHYPFGAGTNSIFDFNSTGTGTAPTNGRLITTPMYPAVGTSGVITAHFDNGTNGQYIAVNGNIPAASFKQTVGTGRIFNGTTNNTFTLGRFPQTASFYNGNMQEMITFGSTTILTLLQRKQVESYLAIKYGQTIGKDDNFNTINGETISGSVSEGDYVASDGSTITWNYTTVGTSYQNNIAGIGRDDNTALNQLQSQSENAGDQVTMALGTATATNQLNVGIITTDKQFIIWGDDAGALTASTATGLVAANTRFTRVWKMQNTNTFAQQVTVYFPVTDFTSFVLPYLIYGATAASLGNGTATLIGNSGTVTIGGVSNYAFTVPAATVGSIGFFSFAGVAINPGGIAGANLWYKADAGVTTSTGVSGWKNYGGTGSEFDVLQATAANQPAYNTTSNLFNYNPTLSFNGTSSWLRATGLGVTDLAASANTAFSVVKQNNVTAAQTYVQFSNTTGTLGIMEWRNIGPQLQLDKTTGGTVVGLPSGGATTTAQSIFDVNYQANNTTFNYNGGLFGTANTTTTLGPTSGSTIVELGARYGTGSVANANDVLLNGTMGETIEYGIALTAQARRQVQSYLAIKYGHTLSRDNNGNGTSGETVTGQTIVYKEGDYIASDSTTINWTGNATYQNNIAGIGRDDNTALLQLQSQSINTTSKGNMITMAVGTLATTNVLNAGTITTDKSFNVWGDDGTSATTSTQTNLAPGVGTTGCAVRLTRQWKLQRTGTGVGAVQVNVDMNSTITLTGLTVNDFDLVIDKDGDGNFATGTIMAIPASSYTGGVITFNSVNWDADGSGSDVFTIVVNKSSFSPNPNLVAASSSVVPLKATCLTSDGYTQFVNNITTPTIKYLQVFTNGNTGYNFTATVANNSPALGANNNRKTDGTTNTTALSARLYTITDAGTNNYPSGMSVRIYYSTADSIATVAGLDPLVTSGVRSFQWFKLPGTAANVLAAQTTAGITGATYLTPSVYGTESGVNYVEFSGITNFSTFGFIAKQGAVVLPVSFTSFTANANGCAAVLNWATATESNSNHYEVEASADGSTFTKVANVASKNSTTGASYNYADNAITSGTTYFRVKAVDNDGKFTYSQIVVVVTNCNGSSVSVSPNPTSNMLKVQGVQSGSKLQLFSINGKQLIEVMATGTTQTINMYMYAKGIYILRIQAANGSISNLKVVRN